MLFLCGTVEVQKCICVCLSLSFCVCVCTEQRLITVYTSSSVYPFVFQEHGYIYCSLMSRCGFPSLSLPLIWKGVHLNLHLICRQAFLGNRLSLCHITLKKRQGKTHSKTRWCMLNHAFQKQIQNELFLQETEPFGTRVFFRAAWTG